MFYAYSHKDETLRDELETYLSLLQRQGVIGCWHDRRIAADSEWAGAIDAHVQSAQIMLLLISADFLASGYCYGLEIQRAMERQEAGKARVIPIILRPVDWHSAPFGTLQALPEDGKPITRWANRDEAFTDVASSIRAAALGASRKPTGGKPRKRMAGLGKGTLIIADDFDDLFRRPY